MVERQAFLCHAQLEAAMVWNNWVKEKTHGTEVTARNDKG
jgi:hypothetical protein